MNHLFNIYQLKEIETESYKGKLVGYTDGHFLIAITDVKKDSNGFFHNPKEGALKITSYVDNNLGYVYADENTITS